MALTMDYRHTPQREGDTYKLDATTTSTIKNNPESILGKAVTVTASEGGAATVGYGSKGKPILGVVVSVEKEYTNADTFVVGIQYGRNFDDVECAGSADLANEGDWVAVNGDGKIAKSDTATTAICLQKKTGNNRLIRVM